MAIVRRMAMEQAPSGVRPDHTGRVPAVIGFEAWEKRGVYVYFSPDRDSWACAWRMLRQIESGRIRTGGDPQTVIRMSV